MPPEGVRRAFSSLDPGWGCSHVRPGHGTCWPKRALRLQRLRAHLSPFLHASSVFSLVDVPSPPTGVIVTQSTLVVLPMGTPGLGVDPVWVSVKLCDEARPDILRDRRSDGGRRAGASFTCLLCCPSHQ